MSATKSKAQRARNTQPIVEDNALQPLAKDDVADDGDFLEDKEYDEDTYKPRPQSPQPFVFMRTLEHLMNDLDNEVLDIDPEYQREVVWTADRMTGLINSLMESFYIPPIILNKKPQGGKNNGKGRHTLVCVDGKQRLSSVRAFINGMIPCHDHRGEKWWFGDASSSQRKKILPGETQKMFLSKEFVTFEFSDLSAEQEEDLFARVQMGVQLSLAEKMRASSGPWQELAKLFVADFPNIYPLMKDRARAKDFQLTLACFSQIIEVMHPTAANGVPTLKTSHGALPKLLNNKGVVDDGLKSHLASVWNTLKALIETDPNTFTNDEKYLRGVQTFAPVEMVAVTVLISMYSNTRNNRLLIGDIKALRIALREHFTDLRLNIQVWRFIWDFIEDLEAIRGAVDGTTSQKLQEQLAKSLPPSLSAPLTAPAISPAVAPAQMAAPPSRKALSILPRFDSVPIKEENEAPGSRPRKRQRTDPSPVNSPARVTASTTRTPNRSLPSQPTATFATFGDTSFSSQLIQNAATTSQNIPSWKTRTLQSSELDDQKPASAPMTGSSYTTRPATEPAVPEPGRMKVSKAPEYQVPLATMFPTVPGDLPTNLAPESPSDAPFQPSKTSSSPPSRQTSHFRAAKPTQRSDVGRLTSYHTNKQGPGGEKSILTSMPTVTAPSVPFTAVNSLPPKPSPLTTIPRPRLVSGLLPKSSRRAPPRPTPAQYDGAIDLTSDSDPEEQRQSLLSSFKGSSSRGKQIQNLAAGPSASGGVVATVSTQQQEPEPGSLGGKLPDGFNPYAKFLDDQEPRHPAV